MRTVTIGDKQIALRANPLALLFYKQAFDSDLIADLLKLQSLQSLQDGDFSSLDMVSLFQIAYAMNKAAKPADVFPTFEEWLAQFETIGFDDPQWIIDVVEEAADGFFRSGKSAPESKEQ
jgi:hypothetical protein